MGQKVHERSIGERILDAYKRLDGHQRSNWIIAGQCHKLAHEALWVLGPSDPLGDLRRSTEHECVITRVRE